MPVAGARARIHDEVRREVAAAAREELAEVGPAALSVRSVARRCGLAPSALYRYFDSRDHLLTALIIEAYDGLAAAARRADRRAGPEVWARWAAVGGALRRAAARRPHEWALVFGSPVPGYAGTDATTAAAFGLHGVGIGILVDAHRAGRLAPAAPASHELAAAVAPLVEVTGGLPAAEAAAGITAWASLLGLISLERFGHFTGAVADGEVWWAHNLRLAAAACGLAPP